MAGRLQDKLALVTAAGQGIGRGIAERFVAEGARVIATDLEAHKLAFERWLDPENFDDQGQQRLRLTVLNNGGD